MIITIMRGTCIEEGKAMLNGEFNNISWWSNDYETVDHYYEGCVIELTIDLNEAEKMDYIVETNNDENYTFGYSEMEYPKGAIWYSISKKYVEKNYIFIREIPLEDINN